jgi:hypothetical protein
VRTKLLRALAHYKAALIHLEAARALVNGTHPQSSIINAINAPLAPTLDAVKVAGDWYAQVVVAHLPPAELP